MVIQQSTTTRDLENKTNRVDISKVCNRATVEQWQNYTSAISLVLKIISEKSPVLLFDKVNPLASKLSEPYEVNCPCGLVFFITKNVQLIMI